MQHNKLREDEMKKLIAIFFLATFLWGCATNNPENIEADQDKANYKQRMLEAAQINVQLGLGYLQQGQVPRAKQKLLLAMQQNPKSATVLDAMAYFWEVTGNNTLADQYYQQAITLEPKSGRALNNYGAYLCRVKQYDLAEKYLLAAANEPNYIDSAAAMENAGLCELLVPNVTQAQVYFKKALQQDPDRSTSYYELARINYNQGNYNVAKQYLNGYNSTEAISPDAFWLGVEIANKLKDVGMMLKYGALLAKHFPNSKQYQQYQKMQQS